MKTSMERSYPIASDLKDQWKAWPEQEYVFMYEDGQFYRAFVCDGVHIPDDTTVVRAYIGGKDYITVPYETPWRLIHKSMLESVSGAEMESIDFLNTYQLNSIRKKLKKAFGVKDEKSKDKSNGDLDVSQIPLATGQFI